MSERLLSAEETSTVYKKIEELRIEPYDTYRDRKSCDLYYELDGNKYRLIYTPDQDWFCDIAYVED